MGEPPGDPGDRSSFELVRTWLVAVRVVGAPNGMSYVGLDVVVPDDPERPDGAARRETFLASSLEAVGLAKALAELAQYVEGANARRPSMN